MIQTDVKPAQHPVSEPLEGNGYAETATVEETAGTGSTNRQVVVIGAGPAGLTAAYQVAKFGLRPLVLEKRETVGGISCTEEFKGYHFDMGGHRFFTKAKDVSQLWLEVMGNQFLLRPRISRIYYRRKFFAYPLKPLNALLGLGVVESIVVVLSYLRWQLRPYRLEESFEQWVTNRFGRRLFQIFFESYTEKLWGIPCSELKAEWAAQRIKDLSLKTAIISMFFKPRKTIKTLIEEFHYPRLGPGMLWAAVKDRVEEMGGAVKVDAEVVEIRRSGNRIQSIVVARDDCQEVIEGTDFVSSMPINELIEKLSPPPSEEVVEAARKLKHRDFLTVCLIINAPNLFPDNWIYVHDSSVRVGRIQNFKNWSPEMVPDSSKTSLGLEYFCTVGDDLWNMPNSELVELGKRELDRIGLAKYSDVEDGRVFRVANAYPVYDSDYQAHLPVVRKFVDGLENLQTIGRNGLHRYNNQDHSMLTGMMAARNLALGETNDLWSVNDENEYHESVEVLKEAVEKALLKLDRLAFGISVGTVSGLFLFLATLILVLKGGAVVGPTMQLLSEFFPGYTVTLQGSLVGLVYGLAAGFVGGWSFAFARNAIVLLVEVLIRRGAELRSLLRVLENI